MRNVEEIANEYPLYKKMELAEQLTMISAMKEYAQALSQNFLQPVVSGNETIPLSENKKDGVAVLIFELEKYWRKETGGDYHSETG